MQTAQMKLWKMKYSELMLQHYHPEREELHLWYNATVILVNQHVWGANPILKDDVKKKRWKEKWRHANTQCENNVVLILTLWIVYFYYYRGLKYMINTLLLLWRQRCSTSRGPGRLMIQATCMGSLRNLPSRIWEVLRRIWEVLLLCERQYPRLSYQR